MELKSAFFGTWIVSLMTAFASTWLWLQNRKHFQGLVCLHASLGVSLPENQVHRMVRSLGLSV
jgi:hypothetical protein